MLTLEIYTHHTLAMLALMEEVKKVNGVRGWAMDEQRVEFVTGTMNPPIGL